MTANKIPSVLFQSNGNSLSIERLLKQAIETILNPEDFNEHQRDNCLDGPETMLNNLDRS